MNVKQLMAWLETQEPDLEITVHHPKDADMIELHQEPLEIKNVSTVVTQFRNKGVVETHHFVVVFPEWGTVEVDRLWDY